MLPKSITMIIASGQKVPNMSGGNLAYSIGRDCTARAVLMQHSPAET